MNGIIDSEIYNILLLITIIGEFLLPWLLNPGLPDVYNPFRSLWVLPAANSVVCEPSSNNAVPQALCCILYNHQPLDSIDYDYISKSLRIGCQLL